MVLSSGQRGNLGSSHKKLLSGFLGRQVDHRQLREGTMLCPSELWNARSKGRGKAEILQLELLHGEAQGSLVVRWRLGRGGSTTSLRAFLYTHTHGHFHR